MTIYLKNISTKEIKRFEVGNILKLSKNLRNGEWVELTSNEETKHELEELKNIKLQELKIKRDEFAKTLIIKENLSVYDIQNSNNHIINIILLIDWSIEERDLFKSNIIILKSKYDFIKKEINTATKKSVLNNININF